uniref:Uncharacterized protein n=1 Tax=Meleagris gallopavo TaxID=9103 RepID=A0A803XXK6_MELGA
MADFLPSRSVLSGCFPGCLLTSGEAEQQRKSKEIDKCLNREKTYVKRLVKILLLGAGESGKSTFLKQICKTVGEMLAYSFFPPLFPPLLLSAATSYGTKNKKQKNPKPTFCSFSVSMVTEQSWPKQLSCLWLLRCLKAVIKMRSCGNTVSAIAVTFAFNC